MTQKESDELLTGSHAQATSFMLSKEKLANKHHKFVIHSENALSLAANSTIYHHKENQKENVAINHHVELALM